MCFFISDERGQELKELTDYEYFTAIPEKPTSFDRQRDYAYFAVKFGWTYEEYASLTPVQKLFVRKEIEKQTVSDTELLMAVVESAIANVHRKKGQKRRNLWPEIHKDIKPPMSKNDFMRLKFLYENRKGVNGG